jgi:hypothetical protein
MRLGRVEFIPGHVEAADIDIQSDGKYAVKIGGTNRLMDVVILRHGPRSALAAFFPEIAALVAPAMAWHMRYRVASDDRKPLWVSAGPAAPRGSSQARAPAPSLAIAPTATKSAPTQPAGSPVATVVQSSDDVNPTAEQQRALIAFGRAIEAAARAHCTGVSRTTLTMETGRSRVHVLIRLEAGGNADLAEALELVIDAVPHGSDYTIVLQRLGARDKRHTLAPMKTLDAAALTQRLAELISDQDGST